MKELKHLTTFVLTSLAIAAAAADVKQNGSILTVRPDNGEARVK